MTDLTGKSSVVGDENGLFCPGCQADVTHFGRELLEAQEYDRIYECPSCAVKLDVTVGPRTITARIVEGGR